MFKSKKFAFQLYSIASLVFGDDSYSIQGDIIQLKTTMSKKILRGLRLDYQLVHGLCCKG